MGYYDEDGNYYTTFQSSLSRRAQRNDFSHNTRGYYSGVSGVVPSNTVTLPCHHIRIGDFLILEGRPCQTTHISISSTTGKYRFAGLDLFTRDRHAETSFTSSPAPSVTCEAILGPTFSQYHVVGIQEGHITAKTESGDIKEGVKILERSNLYGRLASALETRNGSVRVLVLSDEGRDLAVDLKVIHDSKPVKDTTGDAEWQYEVFQAAIRANDIFEVDKALQKGSDINTVDGEGKTALFHAIEYQDQNMIDHLLDKGIDISVSDKSGNTVLDFAVSEPKLYEITFSLLRRGALSFSGSDNGANALLSAAAVGNIDKVIKLLKSGVKPNACDRLGYTALHEAARFGHYEMALTLIQHGADVNAKITHGGTSVIQAVVQRSREHHEYFEKDRAILPNLRGGHLKVVALLLQYEASTKYRRSCDNLSLGELVSQELTTEYPEVEESRRTTERRYLQMILVILNKPPPRKESVTMAGRREPHYDGDLATDPLSSFQLRISYHTSSRESDQKLSPVRDFFGRGIGQSGGTQQIQELELWAKKCEKNSSEPINFWRWVHLPVNNRLWAEDLTRILSGLEDIALHDYWSSMKSFINGSYHEKKGSQACFRQPSFTPMSGSHSGIFSLVIPYFDSESLSCLMRSKKCSDENCRIAFQRIEALKKSYLGFDHDTACLHLPCTLDQSWYLTLKDSIQRDKDQVVVKHANQQQNLKEEGQASITGIPSTSLLMVNHMWIWKLDATTMITAFPDRRHPGQPSLLTHVSKAMQESPPATMGSMISLLLKSTARFVDAPTNSGLEENLFHIFEQGVAFRSQKDAECYSVFYKMQQMLRKLGENKGQSDQELRHGRVRTYIENEICDISNEVEHLCEIKDIKDELSMIQRVLESQLTVIGQYFAAQKQPDIDADEGPSEVEGPSPSYDEIKDLLTTRKELDSRMSKVKFLLADATSVEESLNRLLDLKQKQGSLVVVRDTRSLANDADERAKSSALQSQLLFIFTIVTVVFTPISFTSTFLAVPTREFPHDGGQEVAWGWWQVFLAGLVAEVLTILFIAPWLVREWSVLPIIMSFKTWRRKKQPKDDVSKV